MSCSKQTGGTSATAPVATAVAVQLCQRYPELLDNPQFLKALLLNGATYLGEKNQMNSNNVFVALNRESGAGVVNTIKSINCYDTRNWVWGTSTTTESSYSLNVDSKLREVHITVCSIKDVYFNTVGDAIVNPHACYKITVTKGVDKWISQCNTDNKCSVIFDPPSKGTYNIVIQRIDDNNSNIKTAIVYTSC